ncbi:MAG: hypothetical protein ACJ766_07025 [Thermoleophilaceae bacterium]
MTKHDEGRFGGASEDVGGTATGMTGGWSLDFIKTPAINRVYADGHYRSAIVLGSLAGGHAEAPLPTCDTLLNQPCRRNLAPAPSGAMTIPQARGHDAGR